jgi:hypothetical protein
LIAFSVAQIDEEAEVFAAKKGKGKAIDVGTIYEDADMVSLSRNASFAYADSKRFSRVMKTRLSDRNPEPRQHPLHAPTEDRHPRRFHCRSSMLRRTMRLTMLLWYVLFSF